MPQFLTTSGTSHLIENIIIRAKTELVFITPYLKLSRILFERLIEANRRGVHIKLVYGKSELHYNERKQLESLDSIELRYLENLHAKCYHNGDVLIISSMNLYEFSEKNNREMGIVLTRQDDAECFTDALTEANSIIATAKIEFTRSRNTPVSAVAAAPTPAPQTAPSVTSDVSSVASDSVSDKTFDSNLVVRKLHEILTMQADYSADFKIESRPTFNNDGIVLSIQAEDFPRKGVKFSYDRSIRLDFQDHQEFLTIKRQKREIIGNAFEGYRCFWNRDVIQLYAAWNYTYHDEATTAEYFAHIIKQAAHVLNLLGNALQATSVI